MTKVFIDGSAGTAGLRIHERIAARGDIELISVPHQLRHDLKAKKDALNSADIAFLCLPDEAAMEDVSLIENEQVTVIDTSTAHRVNPDWVYGFPELSGKREMIEKSKRIANPGCHASGFISLVYPLVKAGIIPPEAGLSCFSLTGYSGGGKKMISEYEEKGRDPLLNSPRQYGLGQEHKHLKEMTIIPGLFCPPVFCPIVADYYCGMETVVSLFHKDIKGAIDDIKEIYKSVYGGKIVHYEEKPAENGLLAAGRLSDRDDMEISVLGNEERIILVSRFDNLGKGASGAAVQNMNIIMGVDETTGLVLGEEQ